MGGWPGHGDPYFARGGLTAIDNDQVLMKKWTVRKDNRAQISILTSVYCAEVATSNSILQRDESLSPRYACKIVCMVGFILAYKILSFSKESFNKPCNAFTVLLLHYIKKLTLNNFLIQELKSMQKQKLVFLVNQFLLLRLPVARCY